METKHWLEKSVRQSPCVCVYVHPCHTHWLRAQYDNALVLLNHNGNTPHAAPSIVAKCPQNYAQQTSHYPCKVLKTPHKNKYTTNKMIENTEKHNCHTVRNIKTQEGGTQTRGWQQKMKRLMIMKKKLVLLEEMNKSTMRLTGGVSGRWRLLDMNNQKRPSGWLPVRLTSVKTSPSLSAEKLHLQ